MSLDVYLYAASHCPNCGHDMQIDRERTRSLFDRNITHNLGKMAKRAGCYEVMWRPDEMEPPVRTAAEALPFLRAGLAFLRAHPEECRALNPANGWGSYEGLVAFVEEYIAACEANPTARVEVSR